MKLLILLLILSQSAFSLDPYELSDEEKNPSTEDVLIRKPEKYLRHDSMIYDFNTNLGIKDQRKFTGTDKNRISIGGHISADYEHFSDIVGVDFNYMRKSDSYSQLWYGFQFFQQKTYFDNITQNQDPKVGANPNAESSFQRPNNVKSSVFAGGLGIGYRFKLLMEFFPTDDVFESVDVFANYVTMDETFISQKYAGYGLTTTYGIHKRASTKFFYGGKLSYNFASVTREALGTEGKSDRSFALGWMTLGLDLGLFF